MREFSRKRVVFESGGEVASMHFHHLNVQAVAINRHASGAGNIRAGPQNVGRARL